MLKCAQKDRDQSTYFAQWAVSQGGCLVHWCLPLVVIDVSGAVSPDWVRTEREKLETAVQKLTLNPDKKS